MTPSELALQTTAIMAYLAYRAARSRAGTGQPLCRFDRPLPGTRWPRREPKRKNGALRPKALAARTPPSSHRPATA